MRLDRLVSAVSGCDLVGDRTVEVTSITHDSRRVQAGSLFCCVPGHIVDGHQFAPEAVSGGAVALLCEREVNLGVPEVRAASARRAMAPLSAAFYDHPSRALQVVGITGTDGKSTTVHLLTEILRAAGRPTVAHGNLLEASAINTPEAPELQARLAAARDDGQEAVVMEVTAPALVEHRVDGTWFAAAVFTNLTRDHLEVHGTVERYFAAKRMLFEPGRAALAVVNADDPWGRTLIDDITAQGAPAVHTYSRDDAARLEVNPKGSTFVWRGHAISLQLPAAYNVSNALAAATAAVELGVDVGTAAAALSTVSGLPGRLELVDEGQPFAVVVDYAHTADGLVQTLTAARAMTVASRGSARVFVVFGCGGDRDRGKRPEMGAVAAQYADLAVITSDNPRSEDPMAIIEEVLAGVGDAPNVVVEPDRETAIAHGLAQARAGDVVLVAGKGHETGQTIGGVTQPFDDREVARRLLRGARS